MATPLPPPGTRPQTAPDQASHGSSAAPHPPPPRPPQQQQQPLQPQPQPPPHHKTPPNPQQAALLSAAAAQLKHENSQPVSLTEVVQTIKPADFLTVHQTPCARQGFLTGIGGGAAVGALRWVMGMPIPRAANWGVGVGALSALVQYEYCQYLRRQEREKMKRVVEVYDRKQAESRAQEEEMRRRERRRIAEAEAAERERRAGRGWWRFW